MRGWAWAGFWGFVSGSALVLGAAVAYLVAIRRRGMPIPQRKLQPDALTCWGRQRALARLVRVGRLAGVMGKAVVKTAQAIPEDRLCFEHALRFGA